MGNHFFVLLFCSIFYFFVLFLLFCSTFLFCFFVLFLGIAIFLGLRRELAANIYLLIQGSNGIHFDTNSCA